jgi:hypothetical protein
VHLAEEFSLIKTAIRIPIWCLSRFVMTICWRNKMFS